MNILQPFFIAKSGYLGMRLSKQEIESTCSSVALKLSVYTPPGDHYTFVDDCITIVSMSGQAIYSWRAGALIARFFEEH